MMVGFLLNNIVRSYRVDQKKRADFVLIWRWLFSSDWLIVFRMCCKHVNLNFLKLRIPYLLFTKFYKQRRTFFACALKHAVARQSATAHWRPIARNFYITCCGFIMHTDWKTPEIFEFHIIKSISHGFYAVFAKKTYFFCILSHIESFNLRWPVLQCFNDGKMY